MFFTNQVIFSHIHPSKLFKRLLTLDYRSNFDKYLFFSYFQDEFISNAESSMPDAIVPSSTLTPSTSAQSHQQQMVSQPTTSVPPPVYSAPVNNQATNNGEQEYRNNAAAAAATTALLKSWLVPPELIAESSSGFVIVVNPGGTIEYVSDTVRCHVGHAGQSMRGTSIYNYVLQSDHDKFLTALHPQNLISPSGGPVTNGSIAADSDLNYRRTFAVRFLVGHANNNNSAYEGLFISTVPLRRASTETPSLLCVARKMGGVPTPGMQQQQQQQSSVPGITSNLADLFSTRLDPTSFRILHSETDKNSLSSRAASMSGKCFLEFCHPEDQEIIRAHFLETLQGNNGTAPTSKPYR